jgi:transcriptional regulator with GAF, ATPase, and Fis domain
VAVNCAAVPENLLESELFGHERGAFTGAIRARRGAFELAHQGTLFLDEIGDLQVHLQVKLLRAVQDREIQRVGSERVVPVDVRIIAATNRDLQAAMEAGEFRRDLFYRLSVVTLTMPPLRERREDIVPLIESYLAQFKAQFGRDRLEGIDEEAVEAMLAYDWPGNVREIINVLERAVLLCDDEIITLEDLPEEISGYGGSTTKPISYCSEEAFEPYFRLPLPEARDQLIETFELEYLSRALRRTGGNIGDTARRAGVDPRTLYNKMKAYGLRKESFRD